MNRSFWMGLFMVGVLLIPMTSSAFRISRPPTVVDTQPSTLAELSRFLQRIWDISNGRYSLDVITANPNGSRRGGIGDFIVFNNSGSRKFCTNTDGGTAWQCNANALTAP